MPRKMKVTKAGQVKILPADIYPAALTAITDGSGTYGTYFRLEFSISEGALSGEKRSVIVSANLSRGAKGPSKLLGILDTLSGAPIDLNSEVDVDSYIGKKCRLVLGEPIQKGDLQIQNIEKVLSVKV